MRTVPAAEAKAHFSELLKSVEAGEEIVITRRGRAVARLSSQKPLKAADVLAPLWDEPLDIESPEDRTPEPVPTWDD
ncbi:MULTISPECIES: type II toxin-antitoxin system Phd/YefM family antitoxin [unclassified Wenzhouxiangella]|uniref:type II toxin-antitoxin system Phd/YefM family antitoxin n=1 Tax=unclassified Wenzhouxiangella TaxID=2613841 RepID=UPI000E327204|nr:MULTISPECIES: type II toxin-antitoxin system prevent-host-death family antitoxin [unclassified Wenzhouxiangella]RFF27807.1 type II toxin-antitoxin system prevent-host-death family antitoxin [Wenzhouxiangella sp. 15181]RFP70350.1 type II toxin-antitoxin system prevent-host-death family antitoxin [Wenzhouxiangella sp. 15190]